MRRCQPDQGDDHSARRDRPQRHDALGRLVEATDPLAGITRQAWDALGNLLAVTNLLGHIIDRREINSPRVSGPNLV